MRVAFLLAILTSGCVSSLRDELMQAQAEYNSARYENALVWLESVGWHEARMDERQRLRYLYLRGMSCFRLDRPEDARHYLALARESRKYSGVGMPDTWRRNMTRSLRILREPP